MIFILGHNSLVSQGRPVYPGVQLLDYMVVLFLIFWGTFIFNIFHSGCTNLHSKGHSFYSQGFQPFLSILRIHDSSSILSYEVTTQTVVLGKDEGGGVVESVWGSFPSHTFLAPLSSWDADSLPPAPIWESFIYSTSASFYLLPVGKILTNT